MLELDDRVESAGAAHDPPASGRDHVLAAVLAAAESAPLVPLSDEERALLAEVEGKPVQWSSHEDFMARLRLNDARE